jgi:glycosyltransferase involved in cell wall biosynthesis
MSSKNQLLEELKNFDPKKMDQVFTEEQKLVAPDSSVKLAPIQRVALFAESFPPKVDGVSKSAYLTLRYLQQTGREVLIFGPDTALEQVGSSPVVRLPSIGLRFAPETRVAIPMPRIGRHLDEFQPDMVHLFSPALMCMGGVLAARRRGIPVIANYQTDLPGYARQHYGLQWFAPVIDRWLRFLHNRSHLNLVPSEFTLKQIRAAGYHRLRVWTRGVDGERFNPAHRNDEMRQRLLNGRDPDSMICLYVGRVAPEKRIDLLIDVARLPGVALTIVGDGAARHDLEEVFAGTGTHFVGYMVGDDLAQAYASSDVFTFAGANETFGQVVNESMAAGLPAVVINSGGVTDLINDGVNGYVCDADPASFAEAVKKLRDDPAARQQMGRVSRQIAEQHPWDAIMAQLEDYYRLAADLNERHRRIYHRPSPMSGLAPAWMKLGG